MYLFRLDDACEFMNIKNWQAVENILDEFNIKPLVGIIPNCKDPDFINTYPEDLNFWEKALAWQKKGWLIAMHGFNHVCDSNSGGINPVHKRSEFAGLSLETQKKRIKAGYEALTKKSLKPNFFFAPSHTFDLNTLKAIEEETPIRIISDTVANDVYKSGSFYFLPQQSGKCRKLPFKFTTFSLHPNSMTEKDLTELKEFCKTHSSESIKSFTQISLKSRKLSLYDRFLKMAYFVKRKIKN